MAFKRTIKNEMARGALKIARIVYLSMVRFRLLRLFMFIQKWTCNSLCPSTENSLCNFIVRKLHVRKSAEK